MGNNMDTQYQPVPPPPMTAPPLKPQTVKPVVAGVLLIVVALMGILIAIVFMGYVDIGLGMFDEYMVEDPTGSATGMLDMVRGMLMI